MNRLTRTQLAGGAVLVLALALPLPHRIAPVWAPRIVDISGVPQVGIEAVQTWRHPMWQPDRQEEKQLTDPQGRVAFGERMVWSNGFVYLYRLAGNIATAGLGATFGPDVVVRAAKEGYNGGDFYLSGREPAPIVIIHRDNVCPADEAVGLVPVADKVAPITKRDS